MALSIAIVGQPFAITSALAGFLYNEPRLSVLGLVPLVPALAALLQTVEDAGRVPRLTAAAPLLLGGVLLVASLHHLYAWIGPATTSQFIVLQGVAALAAAALLLVAHRAPRLP